MSFYKERPNKYGNFESGTVNYANKIDRVQIVRNQSTPKSTIFNLANNSNNDNCNINSSKIKHEMEKIS